MLQLPCLLYTADQETGGVRYTVTVDGLQGGHSGAEIHKEHGNSNILMGRALCWLDEVVNFRIAGLSGGLMDNAIPRSTRAVLYVPAEAVSYTHLSLLTMIFVFDNVCGLQPSIYSSISSMICSILLLIKPFSSPFPI